MMVLCDKHHGFDRLCRIIVTKTMLQLQQRIVSIQFETTQQKYENLINIRPDITQRVPLECSIAYQKLSSSFLKKG